MVLGIKTAALLINEFGSLKNLLENADKVKQPKRREVLVNELDRILISKKLVTLKTDVPVEKKIEELAISSLDPQSFLSFTEKMEFRTLSERIRKDNQITNLNHDYKNEKEIPIKKNRELNSNEGVIKFDNYDDIEDNLKNDYGNYETIDSEEKLDHWITIIKKNSSLFTGLRNFLIRRNGCFYCGYILWYWIRYGLLYTSRS